MASMIGDLAVRVGADISDFERGMTSASKKAILFSRKATRAMRKVADASVKMGAAATAASATIALSMAKSSAASAKELKNLTKVANATTEEFQKIAFGASKFGIEADKVSDILKDVNDRVGDFLTTGGGPMADFFEKVAPKIGVTASQFQKLSGPQSLQLYIDSLETANLSQAELTFFLEAMSSDLTNILPLFSQSGKALKAAGDEADALGLIISDIDVQKLDQMATAFETIEEQAKVASNIVGAKLADYLTEIAERFQDLISRPEEFGDAVESAVRRAAYFTYQLADVVHGLRVVFKGVQLVAAGFGATAVSGAQIAMEAITFLTDNAIRDVNSIIGALNKIPKVDIPQVSMLTDSDVMADIREAGDAARNSVAEIRAELHEMAMAPMPTKTLDDFFEAVKERQERFVHDEGFVGPLLPDAISEEEELRNVEQRYKEHIDRLNNVAGQGYGSIEKLINSHWGMAQGETAGAMKSILGTMAVGSKKAFEISKAWAIADALISTFQGIAAGVKLGWPMGIPAVAWAAATGFAQVSAIKSQSFGGAGGAAASGGGTPATAPNPVGVGGSGGGGSNQTLTIAPVDPNAIFSGDVLNATMGKISDFTKDGGKVVTLEQ